MSLSPSTPREPIHHRRIDCRGYRRADGLWDIEGHLTDTKSYAFPNTFRGEIGPGEPIHDMWLRLTLDDELTVIKAEAATVAGPFAVCPAITPAFAELEGLTVGPGWRRAVQARLGGVQGCTHLVELLGPIATTAYQTIHAWRARHQPPTDDDRPRASEQLPRAGARRRGGTPALLPLVYRAGPGAGRLKVSAARVPRPAPAP
jgi:hypothetical protein